MVDVLKHVLVPKHEVLSKEETEQLLERFKIVPKQLPRIQADDVVVQAIGAKPGDIVKITRISHTARFSDYYRLVED